MFWSERDTRPLVRTDTDEITDSALILPSLEESQRGPVNVSYGTYFQDGPAQDVLDASVATGHEVHVDVQDLNKDIRGLKGVGVFSVSLQTCIVYSHQSANHSTEMGKIHLTGWQTPRCSPYLRTPAHGVRQLPQLALAC